MVSLTPIEGSSTIEAQGYDPASQTLAIRFKSGGVYHYAGIPPDLAEEFQSADSPGSFHARNIRGAYEHVKLEPEEDVG